LIVPTKLGLRHQWADGAKPTKQQYEEKKVEHDALRLDYFLYRAAELGAKQFIIDNVETEWIDGLKDPKEGYDNVTFRDLLEHLQEQCVDIDEFAALRLPMQMLELLAVATTIYGYVNAMELAQKKSQRTDLPISDIALATIATLSLMEAGIYPEEVEEWNGRTKSQKTWTAWKQRFKAVWASKDRTARAKGDDGQPFGGAAMQHRPTGYRHRGTSKAATADDGITEALAASLDNLSLAVTNDSNVMETITAKVMEMATSLAKLATSNDRLTKELVDLRKENAALRKGQKLEPKPAPTYAEKAGANVDKADNERPKLPEFKKGFKVYWEPGMGSPNMWVKGMYCHSCGYGTNHDSPKCRRNLVNHRKDATFTNNLGGAQHNKNWWPA